MISAQHTHWDGISNNEGERTRPVQQELTYPRPQVPTKYAQPFNTPGLGWIWDRKMVVVCGIQNLP